MTDVAIINYGMGNIKSVQRGLEEVGAKVKIVSDSDSISEASRIVLPGVGAFQAAMAELKKRGLIEAIYKHVDNGKPLLGICLGMQLLFDKSEEHGSHEGLKIISGDVIEIPKLKKNAEIRKIPHIGWSAIKSSNSLQQPYAFLNDTNEDKFFYFVHSFMAVPKNESDIMATCNYDEVSFTAAIQHKNVTGFQFHPEKSGEIGLKLLKCFMEG